MKMQLVFRLIVIFITAAASSLASAQQPVLGSFKLSTTANDLLGKDQAATFSRMIDIEQKIEWEIHVPKFYDSARPPGIIVYISPQDIINIPSGWLDLTEEKNLIWIAARNSGNDVLANERMVMALLALPLIQERYNIDTNRIYITGFSGGGRVASIVASQFPHLIKGAIYNCGVNFWDQLDDEKIALIKDNRYVFVTGTKDFNLQDTKQIYAKYKKAGVENIKLMVINRMGHANPKRSRFKQALEYLDASL